MKIQAEKREVMMSGGLQRASFGISSRSQVYLIRILRDTLYKNKILAVEREVSTNAWDAHRSVGKDDLPIKVVLPTELEASFIVRDWGPGLRMGHPDEPPELMDILGPSVFGNTIRYGDSSKRESDEEAGTFGIGFKSPFSYNDSFTVTSWYGGLKRIFHAVLDESDMGEMVLMQEAALGEHLREFLSEVKPDCDTSSIEDGKWESIHPWLNKKGSTPEGRNLCYLLNVGLGGEGTLVEQFERWMGENHPEAETGVEIKVPVNPGDVPAFHREAQNLFPYFRPLPDINIHIEEPKAKWKNEHGWLHPRVGYHSTSWVAVMGCVPYRLDLNILEVELKAAGIADVVGTLAGGLYFDIGEVDIVASREELEYKPRTKRAIIQAFINLLQSITQDVEGIINNDALSEWERQVKVREFISLTQVTLSRERVQWGGKAGNITLYSRDQLKDDSGTDLFGPKMPLLGGPDSFVLQTSDNLSYFGRKKTVLKEVTFIPISGDTRLLVRDNLKPWRGYNVGPHDRVVSIRKGHTAEEVFAELEGYIEKAHIKGIPVFRMSQMSYTPYSLRSGETVNQKHWESVFYLKEGRLSYGARLSDNWEIASDHVPDQDDVYVILDRFNPKGIKDFFEIVVQDRALLKTFFGEEMPPIVGYKTTKKSPVKVEELEGTPYNDWILQILKEALGQHPEIEDLMEALVRSDINLGSYYIPWGRRKEDVTISSKELFELLERELGVLHPIYKIFQMPRDAQEVLKKSETGKGDQRRLLQNLCQRISKSLESPTLEIFKTYPLLRGNGQDNNTGLAVLYGPLRNQWLTYIKAVDSTLKK